MRLLQYENGKQDKYKKGGRIWNKITSDDLQILFENKATAAAMGYQL